MQYELVSRALAYVSCFATFSLLMTSVAIAAVNIGKVRPASLCAPNTCIAGVWVVSEAQSDELTSRSRIEALALRLWSAKNLNTCTRRRGCA